MEKRSFRNMPALLAVLGLVLVLAGCDGSGSPARRDIVNGDTSNNDTNNNGIGNWNWHNVTSTFSGFDWVSIAHGNNYYFAFGWGHGMPGGLVRTSANGTTWYDVTFCSGFVSLTDIQIAHGNNRFFTVWTGRRPGSEFLLSYAVFTSTNGTDWYDVTTTFSDFMGLFGIFHANNRFFAIGIDDNFYPLVMTSTNGSGWDNAPDAFSRETTRWIVHGNNRYFVFGSPGLAAGGQVWTSINGTDWNNVTNTFSDFHMLTIVHGNNRFFAVDSQFFVEDPMVWTSTNGTDWYDVTTTFSDFSLVSIAHANNRFFAIGRDRDLGDEGIGNLMVWSWP